MADFRECRGCPYPCPRYFVLPNRSLHFFEMRRVSERVSGLPLKVARRFFYVEAHLADLERGFAEPRRAALERIERDRELDHLGYEISQIGRCFHIRGHDLPAADIDAGLAGHIGRRMMLDDSDTIRLGDADRRILGRLRVASSSADQQYRRRYAYQSHTDSRLNEGDGNVLTRFGPKYGLLIENRSVDRHPGRFQVF